MEVIECGDEVFLTCRLLVLGSQAIPRHDDAAVPEHGNVPESANHIKRLAHDGTTAVRKHQSCQRRTTFMVFGPDNPSVTADTLFGILLDNLHINFLCGFFPVNPGSFLHDLAHFWERFSAFCQLCSVLHDFWIFQHVHQILVLHFLQHWVCLAHWFLSVEVREELVWEVSGFNCGVGFAAVTHIFYKITQNKITITLKYDLEN